MKNKNIFFVSLFALLIIAACKDDDTDDIKPTITDLEVGHNDTIYAGDGMHLEFYAEDNDKLDYYRVMIHLDDEEETKAILLDETFEFDSTFYDNFNGLRNATVHHHEIQVPEESAEGDYHFHLTVVDQSGNTTTEEVELVLSHEDHDHEDEE